MYAAMDVVTIMDFKRLQLNVMTYNELINGHRIKNAMDEARKVFDSMVRYGCEPNIFSYNLMICGYCKTDRVSDASKLLQRFDDKNGLSDLVFEIADRAKQEELEPYIVRYDMLLDGMVESGCFNAAMALFHKIYAAGLKPSVATYNIMMEGLCSRGLS
ncbi:hypothetical protein PTKIN_Ptkin06aG0174900 [Pterospermum kingtungense]